MTYTLIDLIRHEHILIALEPGNAEEVIGQLSQALIDTGFVVDGFEDDVWSREQEFPTGLPTEPIGVAIPHADPDHVVKSAVCVGTLTNPVTFAQMGTDTSKKVQAEIVFMLAIKEKEMQVVMIQQLVQLIQNPKLLQELKAARDAQGAFDLFTESLTSDP